MLIYEVTAMVDSELVDNYERYMVETHIPDLLATKYFSAAFFAKNGLQYKIGYHVDSQGALDSYLKNDAERLRTDLKHHFPKGVELSRQVLEIVKLFPSS